MKRLISMISTEGKSVEQVKAEARAAYQRYLDADQHLGPANNDDEHHRRSEH